MAEPNGQLVDLPADSEASLRVRLFALGEVISEVNATGTPEERAQLAANVIPQQRALNERLTALLAAKRAALGEPEPPAQTTVMQPLKLHGEVQGTGQGATPAAPGAIHLDITGLSPAAILYNMLLALEEQQHGER